MNLRPLVLLAVFTAVLLLPGCASMVSKFVESPIPEGLEVQKGEGFVLHTDLSTEESAVVASFLQDARVEFDRLFGVQVPGKLDVYIFRHGEESSGRWRYAVSLPTGAIHIGYHYALRRGAPPLRLEDLQNGILGDTLRHELSHQYLYRIIGRLPRQPWIYEGLPMLIETVGLERASGGLRTRSSRAVYLEVARWIEDGMCLLPEHVFDMGWQDFYKYAEFGTYSVAETVLDLLHEEAGRPADLGAFCRDLLRRHNQGLVPDPTFRERWRRHVLAHADRQVEELRRDIREGNPYQRLAALEILSYTSSDPRWKDGDALMRRALAENLAHGDRDVRARAFAIALDFLTGDPEAAEASPDDLRLPIAEYVQATHASVADPTVLHWMDRLNSESLRFWDARTTATLGWTLQSVDPHIRASGLGAIARFGGPEFLTPLAERLPDAGVEFTRLAMYAMVGIGKERAAPVLEPCLDSSVGRLRDSAVLALAELRHPRAREMALAMAAAPLSPHHGWAFRALARYPDAETVAFLEAWARDHAPPGDSSPLRALAWMGTPEAFAALGRLFEIDRLRDWVAAEMWEVGRPEYVDFLGKNLARLAHPPLGLIWGLPDDRLATQIPRLVRMAEELRGSFSMLESFLVRKRLAKMGVRVDDGEALFAGLRKLADIEWPHEQKILAQLGAEIDPARALEILIAQLAGPVSARRSAIQCLHGLTGLSHDFHWAAPATHREAAILVWKSWWKENAGRFEWDAANGVVRLR